MTKPIESWKDTTVKYPVSVVSSNGQLITNEIEVPAWIDEDGEIFLGQAADKVIEAYKARYYRLLDPAEIKILRSQLDLTQSEMCELLHLGQKTVTRWESGKERPNRSLNLFLLLLKAAKLSVEDLKEFLPDDSKYKAGMQVNSTSESMSCSMDAAWEEVEELEAPMLAMLPPVKKVSVGNFETLSTGEVQILVGAQLEMPLVERLDNSSNTAANNETLALAA